MHDSRSWNLHLLPAFLVENLKAAGFLGQRPLKKPAREDDSGPYSESICFVSCRTFAVKGTGCSIGFARLSTHIARNPASSMDAPVGCEISTKIIPTSE